MQQVLIHIIPTLGSGGAENVLCSIVEDFQARGIMQFVITIQGNSDDFNHKRITPLCEIVHKLSQADRVKKVFRDNPNAIIMGWMYKGIVAAHMWKLIYGKNTQKLIWNIRHSDFGPNEYYQKIMLHFFGIASHLLKPKIIYCSYRSKEVHEKVFFCSKYQRVIVNRLAKLPQQNTSNSSPNVKPYFLFVGRFNPQKGPEHLRAITQKILQNYPSHELLIAGAGWSLDYFPTSIRHQVKILGRQRNIYDFYQHASVLLFTSTFGEGYPNVLVEAMAVGTIIVAFDAGDAKKILANYPYGKVVDNSSMFIQQIEDYMDSAPSQAIRLKEGRNQQKLLDFSLTLREYQEYLDI